LRALKLVGFIFSATILAYSSLCFGAGIKKCQDENGMWHYGNFADQACGTTDVIKLNSKGSVVGVEKPPPTQEELDKKNKKNKEAAELAKKKKKQRQHDENIIQIYGSVQVIESTRDRKLESIDNNLEISRTLKTGTESDLEDLKTRKSTKKVKKLIKERENAIKSYNSVIKQSLLARDELEIKYAGILTSFREAAARLNVGS
jgi:hypothetical protein